MSKKKRTRPNDQPIEGFADLEDEFTGAGTGDQSEAVAAPSPGGAGPVGTPPHAATLRPAAVRRSPAAPPPWGTVFAASVILAGVGLGAAALLAGRSGSPAWAPTDLLDPAKYAAPLRNPLNLVAMLSVLVGIVAAVGARALNAAMRASTADRAAAERLLEKLTALRLDNEGSLGDPALRDHPNAGTFTAEVLGAWRLQEHACAASTASKANCTAWRRPCPKTHAKSSPDASTRRQSAPWPTNWCDSSTRAMPMPANWPSFGNATTTSRAPPWR